MAQITGTVTRAAPRMIPRKDGSGEFPLYEVWIDGQGPFVARKDVYNQAEQLQGYTVTAITRSEQKGTFLNHYLDFVESLGGSANQANPVAQAQIAQTNAGNSMTSQQTSQQPTAADAMAEGREAQQEAEQRKEISIHRQTATKVAARISGSAQDFWVNVEDLVIFYGTGKHPHARHAVAPTPIPQQPQQQWQQQQIQPQQQNAAAYRQYQEDPGPDPGLPPREDQDIPF